MLKRSICIWLGMLIAFTLSGCGKEPPNNVFNEIEDKHIIESQKKFNLKDYCGSYGDEFSGQFDIMLVEENVANIFYFEYRTASFYIKNVKFDNNGVAKISEDDMGQKLEGTIKLRNNEMILTIYDSDNEYIGECSEVKIQQTAKFIEKEVVEEKIQSIIQSNYKNIDFDVFEVKKESDKYLSLAVKDCYVYGESAYSKFYKIYNIDKDTGKIISLYDLAGQNDKKMEKIKLYVEKKLEKESSNAGFSENVWLGLGEYSKDMFIIDFENKIVSIECLHRYQGNDIWINIPFEIFNDVLSNAQGHVEDSKELNDIIPITKEDI